MVYFLAVIALLLLTLFAQQGTQLVKLERILNKMASQEEELQAILAVVRANGASLVTFGAGLVTIIDMLTTLRDSNPAIADEIDAIRTEAASQQAAIAEQQAKINAILNPPPPPE